VLLSETTTALIRDELPAGVSLFDLGLRLDPFTYIGRVPKRPGISFLLFVGTFPTAQRHSQAFRDALQAAGYSVLLVQIPGVDHNGFWRPLPETVDAAVSLFSP
jgi:acetyl esterase/lipase